MVAWLSGRCLTVVRPIDEDDVAGGRRRPDVGLPHDRTARSRRSKPTLATATGATHAAVLNSGTSALHAAYAAIGVGPGDEIVTSPMTFAATANAALYLGARPVFADVDACDRPDRPDPRRGRDHEPDTRDRRHRLCGPAGRLRRAPPDRRSARHPAHRGCRAFARSHRPRAPVGTLADATALSFHPVKLITTGEGGAVVTDDPDASCAGRAIPVARHGPRPSAIAPRRRALVRGDAEPRLQLPHDRYPVRAWT